MLRGSIALRAELRSVAAKSIRRRSAEVFRSFARRPGGGPSVKSRLVITSSGRDDVKARAYADYAVQILVRLAQDDFLAADDPNWEGVLKHGVYHIHKNLGVDESVMWGEYFFLEAFTKVLWAES